MWSVSTQFELSRRGDAQNVRSMEGLRGFAVLLVFLVHYVALISPWITKNSQLDRILVAIHTIGNAGVDLFFVLSGYLIYCSMMGRPQGAMRFLRRRVARIYPAFCVVFGLYLVRPE
jgi:peptidoglycan/LPS O-acetylase OafA/YrhL